MRIAISGTHRVGKSTLIEALAARLPSYRVIDEPYHQLEEDGHEFSDPPTVDDFEVQLRRSLELVDDLPRDALVDRCPLDFIAYMRALDDDEADVDALRDAMATFDLVVVVGIEVPDRITVSSSEDRRLRAAVDAQIRAIVLDDALGLGIEALEVTGTVDERVAHVLRAGRL
jgi:predicted ATPase